jgi:hypothetical protein
MFVYKIKLEIQNLLVDHFKILLAQEEKVFNGILPSIIEVQKRLKYNKQNFKFVFIYKVQYSFIRKTNPDSYSEMKYKSVVIFQFQSYYSRKLVFNLKTDNLILRHIC